jgi:NAD(P)H-hydrate epimerase
MSVADVNSEYLGVERKILMENAGRGLSDLIWEVYKASSCSSIIIFAGKGGNGGDGMVAARHLANKAEISLYLLGASINIKKRSTLKNWEILQKMSKSLMISELIDTQNLENLEYKDNCLIVDAIFGTGVRGDIYGIYKKSFEFINSSREKGAKIISVDTPSGIDPNTGKSANLCIKPHYTCCFHKQKQGLSKKNAGQIRVLSIGMPPEAETIVGPGDLLGISKAKKWSRKGDQGKILVIGGNEKYSGAPALAAMAALKAGSDLATIFAPKSVGQAIRCYSPELIVQEYSSAHLTVEEIPYDEILQNDVVVVGPGLGRHSDTKKAIEKIQEFSKENNISMIIDADALHLINPTLLYSEVILTPHAGEFSALTNINLESSFDSFVTRMEQVRKSTSKHDGIWIVKGPWDIISGKGKLKYNQTGIPEMTRGGTGDVLSGLAASFLGRTKTPFYAATSAAYINGKAGELTRYNFSTINLIEKIPEAINEAFSFITQD